MKSALKFFGIGSIVIFISVVMGVFLVHYPFQHLLSLFARGISTEDIAAFHLYFNSTSSVVSILFFSYLLVKLYLRWRRLTEGNRAGIFSRILSFYRRYAPSSNLSKAIYLSISFALFFTGFRFIPELTAFFNQTVIYEYIIGDYRFVKWVWEIVRIEDDAGFFGGFLKILLGGLALILIPVGIIHLARFLVEERKSAIGYLVIFPIWLLFSAILLIIEIVLFTLISGAFFWLAAMPVDLLANHLIRGELLTLSPPPPEMLTYYRNNFIYDMFITGAAVRYLILPLGFVKIGFFDMKGGYEYLNNLLSKLPDSVDKEVS